MKFFQEEINLDLQTEQFFNKWFESKSHERQESIRKTMKQYRKFNPKTAKKLRIFYLMQCGNIE